MEHSTKDGGQIWTFELSGHSGSIAHVNKRRAVSHLLNSHSEKCKQSTAMKNELTVRSGHRKVGGKMELLMEVPLNI